MRSIPGQKARVSARARDTPDTTCGGCGSLVAAAAGYCPCCGAPVEAASNTTLRIEPPDPSESPISFSASEPRWFFLAKGREAATGNSQYFWNPPHSIGGSRKAGGVP